MADTQLTSNQVVVKRGAIKAFREHLNRQYAGSENHRHERFQQRTRGYGDYLYRQDREKFNVELAEWLTKTDVLDELAQRLQTAWAKYRAAFGEPPHGTLQQLRAMLEFMPKEEHPNG